MFYGRAKNKRRLYEIAGHCMLVIGGLLFLAGILTVKDQNLSLIDNDGYIEWQGAGIISYGDIEKEVDTLPFHAGGHEGDSVSYTMQISGLPKEYDTLMFRSIHQKVHVYLDDEEVLSFGNDVIALYGKTPGNAWQVVGLPRDYEGKTLRIEFETVYDSYGRTVPTLFFGNRASLNNMVVVQGLDVIIIGIPVFIIGAALLFIGLLFKDNKGAFQKLFYLGVFAVLSAVWMLLEGRIVQLFSGRPLLYMQLIFIVFTLMPTVLIGFIMTYPAFANCKYIRGVFWISILNFVSVQMLQITDTLDYLETAIGTHVVFILLIFGIIWVYLKGRGKWSGHDKTIFVASFVFAIFGILDIVRFYLPLGNVDSLLYTRIGIALFIIILGCSAIRQVSRDTGKAIEERMFKKLAYTDMMTGLPNRTAFEERMAHIRANDERPIVGVVDVNNLKFINDTYGHKSGDEAICRIGRVLTDSFSDNADVYRIGGDEFCVMMMGKAWEDAEAIFEKMKSAFLWHDEDTEYPLTAAYGYVQTGEEGIDKAFIEADRIMYACKKAIKEKKDGKTS